MSRLVVLVLMGCGGGPHTLEVVGDPGRTAPDDPADPDATQDPDLPPGGNDPATTVDGWPLDIDLRVCGDGTADFTDIQAAIDASSPGDTIGVCPGTYGPFEVLWSFDVTVTAIDGPEVTTLDGGNDTAVFVKDGTLELSGFRVTGTGVDEEWSTDHGGAFTIEEGEVTIRNCVVEGVTGPFALVFDEDLLVMEDVVWKDNTSDMLWFLYQGDEADITRNTVTGGIHQSLITTIRLDRLDLRNTVFSGIRIDTGLSAFDLTTNGTGPLVVRNNVFYDIDDLDPWGGRVFAGEGEILNNIVMGCDAWDLEPIDASFTLFWDNGVDYADSVDGENNRYVDPMFVDPVAGDFHLRQGSPAIDAGDPRGPYRDADGTRNDMGAYGGP